MFLVFFISGLWHGAAITFVIWGAIHGIIIVLEKATIKQRVRVYKIVGLDKDIFSNRIVFGAITFLIVSFAWVFFRANSMPDALYAIKNILSFKGGSGITSLGLSPFNMYFSLALIFILIAIEFLNKQINVVNFFNKQNLVFRWGSYLVVIFMVLFYGIYGQDSPEFLYFKF